MTYVHGVVGVVGSSDLQWVALVALIGEYVGWTALILKVVAVEAQSAPAFLMLEHAQVPTVETDLAVAGGDGRGDTRCCCQNGCPLGSTEVSSSRVGKESYCSMP